MKPLNLKIYILFAAVIFFSGIYSVNAQGLQDRPDVRPPKLEEQLNLSREQIQQIRRIRQEQQPKMREAQDKLRDANRALDLAVYADEINEETIKSRLLDVQKAQAEVVKIKTATEFEVRKVLTAEQLAKFRQLREDFIREMEQRREENQERRNERRENRQQRQQKPNDRPNF